MTRRSTPFAPLAWLLVRGWRNRLMRRAQRIRQPRYAFALIAGLAYFWLVLGRPGRPAPFGAAATEPSALAIYAFGLAILTASWWLFGSDEVALAFSPADVQLLFPAPVTRRQLVLFKLLQAQFVIWLSTVIWLVLLGGSAQRLAERAVALWALFTTLHLHRVGASLVRDAATQHGAAGRRRSAGALLVVGAAAAALLWSVITRHAAMRTAFAAGDALGALETVLTAPAAHVALYPFQLLLAPLFAPTSHAWTRAIVPALFVVAVHYLWVLHTDTAFEESAAEHAARRARTIANLRARRGTIPEPGSARRRVRLPLVPTGRPAMAIPWKNVLAIVRTIALRTVIVLVIVVAVLLAITGSVIPGPQSVAAIAGRIAIVLAGVLAFFGPLWIRNDLRLDLLQLELLRSYPLRGATIVRSEIVGSLATLVGLQYALLLIAFVCIPFRHEIGYTLSDRTALLAMLVIALPLLDGMQLLIQNAGALLFPAWMRLGLSRPGGVEAVGQSILTMVGSWVALIVLLAIPGAIGGVIGIVATSQLGLWGLVPGAIVGAAIALVELWVTTAWLGRVFERTEPFEVEPAM